MCKGIGRLAADSQATSVYVCSHMQLLLKKKPFIYAIWDMYILSASRSLKFICWTPEYQIRWVASNPCSVKVWVGEISRFVDYMYTLQL